MRRRRRQIVSYLLYLADVMISTRCVASVCAAMATASGRVRLKDGASARRRRSGRGVARGAANCQERRDHKKGDARGISEEAENTRGSGNGQQAPPRLGD